MKFSVDIYSPNDRLKIALLVLSLVVAGFSIYFTDILVNRLEEREQRQIQLYAETMEYVYTSETDVNNNFFFNKIKEANKNNTVPEVWEDGTGHLESLNIEIPEGLSSKQEQVFLRGELMKIKELGNAPIVLDMGFQKQFIYYGESTLLKMLKYYPLVQLLAVFVFGFLAYLSFSYSRKSEQNRVWVGLAKETAHQLGTPLSSLTAWVEFFKTDPERYDPSIVTEIEKDVFRLDTITTRFSNIGSLPVLKDEDVAETVETFISYLKKRISSKVHVSVKSLLTNGQTAPLNRYLFEWVIENIVKNAVDAMVGVGKIVITIENVKDQIAIDIADNGKGIDKKNIKRVFNPGFSTKKRGWGLGLTLAKRIIENYHGGTLVVKASELNKGTTFRILLPQN